MKTNDIKEEINMRYFLRNIRAVQQKIKDKQIVLLKNTRDNINYVIMTWPKYEEITIHKHKPTIKEVDKVLKNLSGKWPSKIDPLKYQKKIRAEWNRKLP